MCRLPGENLKGLGQSSLSTPPKTKILQAPSLQLAWVWSLKRPDSGRKVLWGLGQGA